MARPVWSLSETARTVSEVLGGTPNCSSIESYAFLRMPNSFGVSCLICELALYRWLDNLIEGA
jgi:hypothetical protein